MTAYPDNPHLAPAFFVSLYEGLMIRGSDTGFQRGLAPILAVGFFATFFYIIIRLLLGRFTKSSKAAKS